MHQPIAARWATPPACSRWDVYTGAAFSAATREREGRRGLTVHVHGRPHLFQAFRLSGMTDRLHPYIRTFCVSRCSLSLMGSAGGHLDRLRALGGCFGKHGLCPPRSDLSCHHCVIAWSNRWCEYVPSKVCDRGCGSLSYAAAYSGRYSRSLANSAQTMRAFLLASATVATLAFRLSITLRNQLP